MIVLSIPRRLRGPTRVDSTRNPNNELANRTFDHWWQSASRRCSVRGWCHQTPMAAAVTWAIAAWHSHGRARSRTGQFYVVVKETSHRVLFFFFFLFCLFLFCFSFVWSFATIKLRFIGLVTKATGHRSIGLEEGARRARRRRNRWRQAMAPLSCGAMPSTEGSAQLWTTLGGVVIPARPRLKRLCDP